MPILNGEFEYRGYTSDKEVKVSEYDKDMNTATPYILDTLDLTWDDEGKVSEVAMTSTDPKLENATVENKAANGSAVTIKDNAYKVYFKNNAIISASHDQAIYIGQGSNIFVYALKGSTITGTSHSIGITQGYLCLSNQTTLKSSTASGDASVYVASPGKMMGVNKGKCKDNL